MTVQVKLFQSGEIANAIGKVCQIAACQSLQSSEIADAVGKES